MNRLLYSHQQSNFSRKVRILLAEKKIDYEIKEIDLRNKPGDFLEVSPIGQVPVFVDADGTTLWDSTIITEYLDEKYPEPAFYPRNLRARLECRKWEELADALGDNVIRLWVLNMTNKSAPLGYQIASKLVIDRIFPVFDRQLSQSDYLLGGETWTAADVAALCSVAYYSLRFTEDWKSKYQHLKNWFDKLHERDSVHSTMPKKCLKVSRSASSFRTEPLVAGLLNVLPVPP